MKTNQVMLRKMGVFEVQQRTSDGYFDGAALLYQWKQTNPKCRDTVKDFIEQSKVQTFLSELEKEMGDNAQPQKWDMANLQSVVLIKGRNTKNGRTKDQVWMHPYLFIKFAMWINPKFELQVIKFVADEMIKYRNMTGDAYKRLAEAISKLVGKDKMKDFMPKIAKAINLIVFGNHETNERNKHGNEKLQRDLFRFELKVAELIEEGFIKSEEELTQYLRKKWDEKFVPSILK